MLKVCTAFRRKPGMTVAQYQSYWSSDHPAFVKRLPGLRGYQQNRPLPESFGFEPAPPYDGLVELWFDDSAALKTMSASQEYADLIHDEEAFVDRPSIDMVFTTEAILKPGARPEGGIKRISYLRRSEGTDPLAFQTWIQAEYGPRVAANDKVTRYVQSLPRLNGYRDGRSPAWDCIDMAWFATLEDAMGGTDLSGGMVQQDQPPRLYCHEHRIISIE